MAMLNNQRVDLSINCLSWSGRDHPGEPGLGTPRSAAEPVGFDLLQNAGFF
jgi:hypothetical protein